MKNGWTIAAVGIAVLVLLACVGGAGMLMFGRAARLGMMGRLGYPMMNYPMWGWGVPALLMLLLIVGVIIFIVWVWRRESVPALAQPSANPPLAASNENLLDVLKMRYAKGEITKEQFDAMKRDLGIPDSAS